MEQKESSGELDFLASYLPYEKLQNEENTSPDDLLIKADNLSKSLEWKDQFEAMDTLRLLNKYYPEFIVPKLDGFRGFLIESMNNLRSNVSKNCLLFLQELYMFPDPPEKVNIFPEILPFLILKA